MTIDEKLNSPAFFAIGEHYRLFDRMRLEDPVHWTESPDGRGVQESPLVYPTHWDTGGAAIDSLYPSQNARRDSRAPGESR